MTANTGEELSASVPTDSLWCDNILHSSCKGISPHVEKILVSCCAASQDTTSVHPALPFKPLVSESQSPTLFSQASAEQFLMELQTSLIVLFCVTSC